MRGSSENGGRKMLPALHNSDTVGQLNQAGLFLNHRLTTLRELAATLLSEVEEIATVRPLDIERGINIQEEVQRYEAELIRRALKLTGGHQARAARLLGLKKTTLHSKIKRYKLLPQDRL
jgi:transcriptional regulator with GAF, ATPase, and Fis domain